MNDRLYRLIESGAEIVTPTNRLSRHLLWGYAKRKLHASCTAWNTPRVLSWENWCQHTWQSLYFELTPPQSLLDSASRLLIWQDIIRNLKLADEIMNIQTTAKLAVAAYVKQKTALIELAQNRFHNDNVNAFIGWHKDYEEYLHTQSWIDDTQLADLIALYLSHNSMQQIAFYGFDLFTPQQQKLISTLKDKGIEVHICGADNQHQCSAGYQFTDKRSEIRAVAAWAKQTLQDNPDVSIGIIALNLRADLALIEDEFGLIVAPSNYIGEENAQEVKPYSVALGRDLPSYPLICTALDILSLAKTEHMFSIATASTILRSTYLGDATAEASCRALFDTALYQVGLPELRLAKLIKLARRQPPQSACPRLTARLEKFQEKRLALANTKQSFRLWAKTFSELLDCLGWLTDRTLSSHEYQVANEWQNLLQQFAGVDVYNKIHSYNDAFSQLKTLAKTQRFQPQTRETPIQIMGLSGAAGMQFDYAWVFGVNDQNWPPETHLTPFLPRTQQIEAGLPEASAEGQLAYASEVTRTLTASVKKIIFSYSTEIDGQERSPSRLIPIATFEQGEDPVDYCNAMLGQTQLTSFTDDNAPKCTNPSRGKVAVLTDQAACPFRAFANHRLNAQALDYPVYGFDAKKRGKLVHKVLEVVWRKIGNSETLLTYQKGNKLKPLIEDQIKQLLEKLKKQDIYLPELFFRVEHRRLTALTEEWLQLESSRPPFEVIACEQKTEFKFAEMEFKLYIDRLDRLAGEDCAIIDYKTGKNIKLPAQNGDTLEDPQLPLYALTQQSPVGAVLYGKISHDEKKLIGYAKMPIGNATLLSEDEWQSQMANWQEALKKLIQAYHTGEATVTPKNSACQYCKLSTLCRIDEKQADIP